MAWTFLRPNGFMQNFADQMAATIKGQGAVYQPAADARISQIGARDIASFAAKVLTEPGHEGNAYDLFGPQALSYDDTARILSRQLGKDIKYIPVTDNAAREDMIGAGVPDFTPMPSSICFGPIETALPRASLRTSGHHWPRPNRIRSVRARLRGCFSLSNLRFAAADSTRRSSEPFSQNRSRFHCHRGANAGCRQKARCGKQPQRVHSPKR